MVHVPISYPAPSTVLRISLPTTHRATPMAQAPEEKDYKGHQRP
jgi:hypothetical protein